MSVQCNLQAEVSVKAPCTVKSGKNQDRPPTLQFRKIHEAGKHWVELQFDVRTEKGSIVQIYFKDSTYPKNKSGVICFTCFLSTALYYPDMPI